MSAGVKAHLGVRPGWTRIQVIVAVLVALTALGLVVTAVLRSRDPAQRVECAMHLADLGKAIQAYHAQHKTLPASCIAPGYATWAVQLAPFLKQGPDKALEQWDLGLPYYSQPSGARERQVPLYYCPARRGPVQLSTSGDIPLAGGNLANYAGALGDYGCAPTSDNAVRPWTSPDADGALMVGDILEKKDDRIVRWKARTTLDMLKRGPTYTILLGEKHVKADTFGQGQFGDGSVNNGDYPASFARLADPQHGLAQSPSADYNLNFGSWHPGICQFLMADSSVWICGNNVSMDVVQQRIPRGLPVGD